MLDYEKVATLRKDLKISQSALAEKSGIAQSHISELERGLYTPTIRRLGPLAEALGVTVSDLFK